MTSEGEEEYDDFIETNNDTNLRNQLQAGGPVKDGESSVEINTGLQEFDLLGVEVSGQSQSKGLLKTTFGSMHGTQDLLGLDASGLSRSDVTITQPSKEPLKLLASTKPSELDEIDWRKLEDSELTQSDPEYVDSPIPLEVSGSKSKQNPFSIQLQTDTNIHSYETLDLINMAVDYQQINIPVDNQATHELKTDSIDEAHRNNQHLQHTYQTDIINSQQTPIHYELDQQPKNQTHPETLPEIIHVEDHSADDSSPHQKSQPNMLPHMHLQPSSRCSTTSTTYRQPSCTIGISKRT
jgi:hypothetical protein